jgi:hypothetical protein
LFIIVICNKQLAGFFSVGNDCAAQSKTSVSGRSLGGTASSNLAGGACLYVVSVVCCQVEVIATGRSLVQRSPTDCVSVVECGQVQQ